MKSPPQVTYDLWVLLWDLTFDLRSGCDGCLYSCLINLCPTSRPSIVGND